MPLTLPCCATSSAPRSPARWNRTLPPEQRAVVELTFYHGHSYQEISEIVGSPVNTIKTRMFYARQRLAPVFVKLGISPRS